MDPLLQAPPFCKPAPPPKLLVAGPEPEPLSLSPEPEERDPVDLPAGPYVLGRHRIS